MRVASTSVVALLTSPDKLGVEPAGVSDTIGVLIISSISIATSMASVGIGSGRGACATVVAVARGAEVAVSCASLLVEPPQAARPTRVRVASVTPIAPLLILYKKVLSILFAFTALFPSS